MELGLQLARTSVMRFSFKVLFAVALLPSCCLGQDSASASSLRTASAAVVSRPVDLTPNATGAVPKEQIRELLRRAEEKDLETISGSASTPTSSVWRSTNSMVTAR